MKVKTGKRLHVYLSAFHGFLLALPVLVFPWLIQIDVLLTLGIMGSVFLIYHIARRSSAKYIGLAVLNLACSALILSKIVSVVSGSAMIGLINLIAVLYILWSERKR